MFRSHMTILKCFSHLIIIIIIIIIIVFQSLRLVCSLPGNPPPQIIYFDLILRVLTMV
jgi:hypothetical protein